MIRLHVLRLGGDVLRLGELLLLLVDLGRVGQYWKLVHQFLSDPPCRSSANREADDRAVRPKVTTKCLPRWQAKLGVDVAIKEWVKQHLDQMQLPLVDLLGTCLLEQM